MLFLAAAGHAQEEPYYFYKGKTFGSEALFNPLSLVINGGMGILQYPDQSRRIFDINYRNGWRNVWDNLGHPLASISEYGWKRFLENELFPGSLQKKNAQYWPNYQNHLIGGGMSYVAAAEWYRYHNIPSPKLLAAGTLITYHLLNEVIENNAYVGTNVDPIADLYFFDPLGIALFSMPEVPRFFSEELNLADWSTQPTYAPGSQTLENHGQNYSIKYKFPFSESVSFFYYWGLTGLVGASYRTGGGANYSAGAGLRAKGLVESGDQSNGRKLTADMTWNVGFFYDRENSLLASLLVSGISDYKVHMNIYPGVVRFGVVSPGFFLAVGEGGNIVSGINVSLIPVGLAARIQTQ